MNVRLFKRAAIAVATALVAGLVTGAPVVAQDEPSESSQDSREELVGRRTQSSKTFRNPDGTVTTRLFSGPVHYRGRDGRWKEIDSSLVVADQPGYALRIGGLLRSRGGTTGAARLSDEIAGVAGRSASTRLGQLRRVCDHF